MSSYCTVCDSPRRSEVDEALKTKTIREVAAQFGLSRSSVHRHKQSCIPVSAIRREVLAEQATALAPREPRDALQPTTTTDASRVLTALKDRFIAELEVAERSGKPLSLPIVRELRSTLELIVKTSIAQEARGFGDERATTVEYTVKPFCCPRHDAMCETCEIVVGPAPAPVEEPAPEVVPEVVPTAPEAKRMPSFGEWAAESLRQAEIDDGD